MTIIRTFLALGAIAVSPVLLKSDDLLSPDKLVLLQDAAGWEYIQMGDSQNGFPTQHTCFDGQPHPDACSGNLTLTSSNTFVQRVSINHQTVSRHGTYELNGNQLAFYDEFGTRDGPYTIDIDTEKKLMTMNMAQIKVNLQLEKEYKKLMQAKKKHAHGS